VYWAFAYGLGREPQKVRFECCGRRACCTTTRRSWSTPSSAARQSGYSWDAIRDELSMPTLTQAERHQA